MSAIRIILFICFFTLHGAVFAGSDMVFQLRDGSAITGQLVGVEKGHYIIKSTSLGRIQVNSENVLSMTSTGSQPASNPLTIDTNALIQQTQSRISADAGLLQDVQSLSQDPELAALLADPTFISMVMSGNMEVMQNDPRIQKLMNHPQLRALVSKLSVGH